jgi:hypothetical protein
MSIPATPEVINTETGEIISAQPADSIKAAAVGVMVKVGDVTPLDSFVKAADLPLLRVMEQMDTLNWRNLQPHQTAFLLMQKPFTVSGGGTMFLTFKQALLYAVRAYELNLSPFSSEIWFDPNKSSVNLTLEGKKVLARNLNLDIGPAKFEEMSRTWTEVPKSTPLIEDLKKQGFTKDIGIRCKIRVGPIANQEYAEYICWLSEWAVTKSPVWQSKPLHMLQTRAYEKALSMAIGTGASDAITE